jgi:cytochrome P450
LQAGRRAAGPGPAPGPSDDLLSDLVAVRESGDGRLSDSELLSNLTLLLIAGVRDEDQPARQRP